MTASEPWHGPIVDAHQHFWEPEINHHPWLSASALIPFRYGDYTRIKRRYLPSEYLADAAGHSVLKTVYVEAEWDPNDPIGETRYVSGLAERFGFPNAIVAQAWLDCDSARQLLKAQARFPLVRSVRHKPKGALTAEEAVRGQRSAMADPAWRAGYARLAEYGLHFDLQTPWWHLADALALARDFPETQIILNHTGLPGDRRRVTLSAWRTAMAEFATAPNVAVKISGLGERDRPWTIEANRWIVEQTIALFSPDRVMFGSNFPVDSLCASFDTIFSGFKTIVATWPECEQYKMFYGNASRIYRLDDRR